MKLDGHKLLHEDEQAFHVRQPSGEVLRIAKEHLHHGTVQKIQQHFADGGEVKEAKPGPLDSLRKLITRQPDKPSSSPSVFDTAGAMKEHNARLEQAANAEKMARGGVVHAAQGFPNQDAAANPQEPGFWDAFSTGATQNVLNDEQRIRAEIAAGNTSFGDIGRGVTKALMVDQPQPWPPPASAAPAPVSTEASPAAPMPASAPPSAPAQAPMPGVSGEFNSGLKQELSGIQAQGAAAQEQARQESAAYTQRQAGLQKMQSDLEGQMAAHTARVEKLQGDILNGKIDPNRFWNTRTTGQKITAALGMILGGAGAGVTGQPNYAIQAIDKAIDRDLESQKLELGKKETMLGYYMQQGHQLMAAHQLAKADYMDIISAQLMKAAADGGGQKAAAVAQQLAGAAKMGADQMRRQATLQGLQIQGQKMGVDFQRAQLGAMQGLYNSQSGGGTNLDPRAEMYLPEEMRGRIVRLGDGSAALARTPKDAEEVKKTQETTGVLRDKLRRYNDILENGSPVISPSDRATAQAMHESILTDINGLAGLNRFTHEEAKIFAGRVPDITNIIKPGAKAKLKELGREIDEKVWNMNRAYLSMPQKRRPPG